MKEWGSWRLYPNYTQPGEAVFSWTLSYNATLISDDLSAKDADSYGIENLPSSLAFKKVVRVCLETFGLAIVFELGPGEMTTREIEMDEHRKCRRL